MVYYQKELQRKWERDQYNAIGWAQAQVQFMLQCENFYVIL